MAGLWYHSSVYLHHYDDMCAAFCDAVYKGLLGLSLIHIFNQPQNHVTSLIFYFAASLILFLFLMKYILDSSSYEYIVYSICGASRGTVINLMYIEVFCSSAVASLAAVVVHRLFYNVFFDKINMLQGLRYRFIDYLLIMLFICIAILICSIPFIVSYYKKGLIASKNQYRCV